RKLHCQQSKQRCELDDRVQCHRTCVFERIAYGVANNSSCVQIRALRFKLRLHDLLRVVPCAAGVGHEDRLVEAEQGDGNQITDKEVRIKESKTERCEKHREEDIEHSPLGILRADLD